MDTYTKLVLTVIAAALLVIAFRGVAPVPVAQAADRIECRIEGPIRLAAPVEIGSFRDKLQVEVERAFAGPGTSQANPLFVREVR